MVQPNTGTSRTILLTGATGYVGGRLLSMLHAAGHHVRCLARRPEHLRDRVAEDVELVQGDVLDRAALERAMEGVSAAYYLIHSLGLKEGFEAEERQGAEHFAEAARVAGLERLIYLGGLGAGPDASPHLASRYEVGRILRESGVPTIELRAAIILGSGSLSFELIRALTERLPAMVVPRWTWKTTQPIAIDDVLVYLLRSLDIPLDGSCIYQIGGPDQVSYLDLMREFARQRGLRRLMIPVPVLTPRISSLWLGLVTPVYARIGRKLIDSIATQTIVTDDAAMRDFDVQPRGVRDAIDRALRFEDQQLARTRWNDALSSVGSAPSYGGQRFGSRLVDSRAIDVACTPTAAFAPIRRIGGETGWYFGNGLWALRGFMDLLVGGVGMRRGRRDPDHLAPGDTLDCWRVEAVEPDRLLRLRAEMKLPGRAWLQFEVAPTDYGAQIRQTALFDPRGLGGLCYWYALWPVHQLVFGRMLRAIGAQAEQSV